MTAVGLDVTDDTKGGVIDGPLAMAIFHPIRPMAEATVAQMVRATTSPGTTARVQIVLEFTISTPENV